MTNQPATPDLSAIQAMLDEANITKVPDFVDLPDEIVRRTNAGRNKRKPPQSRVVVEHRQPGPIFVTEAMKYRAIEIAAQALYTDFPLKKDDHLPYEELTYETKLWWEKRARVVVDSYNMTVGRNA